MKLLKCTITILFFALLSAAAHAQPSLAKMKMQIDAEEKLQPLGRSMQLINSTQAGLLFKNNSLLRQADLVTWLTQKLQLRSSEDQLVDDNTDVSTNGNYLVKKLHQYYKGIKVEHGVVNSTSLAGNLAMMQLEYYSIPDQFNIRPSISEQSALEKAMQGVGANLYSWQSNDSLLSDFRPPHGELVIIQTYKNEGEICLAYKFTIYAKQPLSRNNVYINAWNGSLVLNDPIIKHLHASNFSDKELIPAIECLPELNDKANIYFPPTPPINLADTIRNRAAYADTRYNGRKIITADSAGIDFLKPYRLRQVRNGQKIITLDYQRKPSNTVTNFEAQSVDFTDNDNNWSTAEFANPNLDNAAMDVHHGMQYVSDYWRFIHSRNGWDNNNGSLISYVHAAENLYSSNGTYTGFNRWYDNAYWDGIDMHFGDGNGGSHSALTTIDISAHEMGHAITEKTSALVYRWESGALNEGFSDIWAACVTNYAISQDASLSSESVWRIGEKCWNNTGGLPPGLRDMQTPRLYKDPDTYNHVDSGWKNATYLTCPIPVGSSGGNDDCGVHTNSGVLNKWFFLIAQGEQGKNTRHFQYNITGMGIPKAEKIAYLMELNLTPNAGFLTAKNVSIYAAANLYGYQSAELQTVKDAWVAVGLDTLSIYKMDNTPVFTNNIFTSIAVGKGGYVWAGTSYSGLYRFNGSDWEKLAELPDVKINDIKADKNGGIWIAQSGKLGQTGGGSSIAGGVNYYATPTTNTSLFYTVGAQIQVPTRNARCIFVDTSRTNDGTNPRVWMAGTAYFTSGNSTSGMLGQGLYNTNREFVWVNQGINIASGTVGCLTVGGNKKEVWTFVQANNGVNQLLTYSASTSVLINTFDQTTTPELPAGFVARAIYGDSKKRIWVGLANGGVRVRDEFNIWHTINSPSLFPTGTSVNYNAIAGDKYGDVYIGTTNGLVFFDVGIGQRSRLDSVEYFKRYGLPNGLPSNNINAIAYDTLRFKVMIATDSGIVFWEPLCLDGSCNLSRTNLNSYAETMGNGNWSNPGIWSSGLIPDSTTNVAIMDTVAVDINARCHQIYLTQPGFLKVNPGINLIIYESKKNIQTSNNGALRRRRR